jgi:hypothetical protein
MNSIDHIIRIIAESREQLAGKRILQEVRYV